jgi:eukaryotic-like serine/threonine-protein kinase
MSDSDLLETQLPTTPTTLRSRSRAADQLPEDLLRESAQRLGILALVWVVLFTLGLVLNHLVAPLLDMDMRDLIPWGRAADAVGIIGIGVSLWIWHYSKGCDCNAGRWLDVALWYQLLLAFGIGIVNQWEPMRLLAGRLSWLCVLILIFPMIIPNTPRRTLYVSLAAATMDPVGILVGHLRGLEVPSVALILWNYLPNYVCAFIAVIPSKILTRLGAHVQRARELGSYRLVELIGRGGMGEVWRATHRMLARPAAIKLIKPEILGAPGGPEAGVVVERFRREAEAASALQSPHTIRLYDFGETRAGTFYFVMELLDGLDLETLVRRFGPVPAARVVEILRQTCHSLGEAHDRGLVHRDVKPANIYLCRMGREYDFMKVLDFGLVKYDEDQNILDTIKTNAEMTTGTPAYMAPEMANGETIDRRADIYALGCVAYWLLTGQMVFEADSPLRMLIQHIQATPVPPSIRSGRPVPRALEDLILRCLAKSPADRPATVDELVAALDEITLDQAWTQADAREWWEANIAVPADGRAVSGPVLAIR